mmetsp:Transcript_66993/g.132778  ORF Transcript_66993/g.132778 Transcript_66993/m.132778 type:complete len:260 (+) Transcript_66993:1262-2041(+)
MEFQCPGHALSVQCGLHDVRRDGQGVVQHDTQRLLCLALAYLTHACTLAELGQTSTQLIARQAGGCGAVEQGAEETHAGDGDIPIDANGCRVLLSDLVCQSALLVGTTELGEVCEKPPADEEVALLEARSAHGRTHWRLDDLPQRGEAETRNTVRLKRVRREASDRGRTALDYLAPHVRQPTLTLLRLHVRLLHGKLERAAKGGHLVGIHVLAHDAVAREGCAEYVSCAAHQIIGGLAGERIARVGATELRDQLENFES